MPIPTTWSGPLLSLLRIFSALAFTQHGTSKLFGFPGTLGSPDRLTLPLGVLETVGGALLVLGLFTRPVAFLLSGLMAVAYWWVAFRPGWLLSPAQRRRGRAALLLHLPLPRRGGRGRLEFGPGAGQEAKCIGSHPPPILAPEPGSRIHGMVEDANHADCGAVEAIIEPVASVCQPANGRHDATLLTPNLGLSFESKDRFQ